MAEQLFDTTAILLVLAALFGVVNHKFVHLPFTIGLLVAGLVSSIAVLALDAVVPGLGLGAEVRGAVSTIDFSEALMLGMLGFLLFAGALHVDLDSLLQRKGPILTLASVGVVISTVVVSTGSYFLFDLVGIHVPFAYCLVFGALISPTDPIAVLGIMKTVGAPESLEVKVAGESLFNDGVGVIVFSVLLSLAAGSAGHGHHGESPEAGAIAMLFVQEVGGGVLMGLVLGWIAFLLMRSLDEPNLEIIISVALVMLMVSLGHQWHISSPLACVVAGLLVGNHGRRWAMSRKTRESLDLVWSFVDEALNAILFLLIGIEVVAISFEGNLLLAAIILIPLALLARFLSVALPVSALRLGREFPPGTVRVLTWGGIKGGISVALALSLPDFEGRDAVLAATYAIVIFSIIGQGLTIGRVIKKVAT